MYQNTSFFCEVFCALFLESPESFFYFCPVDGFKKSVDVFSALCAVIGDVGVFKHVHHKEGCASSQMSYVVFIHPSIEEFFIMGVAIENDPADAAHYPGS